ncbi:FecR family protein [Sulfurimonas microaerophilic]|uniref:FecR family protein n=1 Tax=Sulfurimonas microaerophilic TaxID=3058392 RepID=UPI0027154D32|nr:FecR family protein [Sulfurimonas sp. hsl 1-7]
MKLFLMLMIASFTYIYASVIGSVEYVQGNVKVKSSQSIKKVKVQQGYQIQEGDIITSYKDSYAKIVLVDNSTLVLDADSIVHFGSASELAQEKGRVYYKVTSKKVKNSFKVKTDFAIIGIKGTTFIVKAEEQKEVLLQEGLVGINSIKEEFELYRKKINADFEAFKAQQQQGFEEYKNGYSGYEKVMTTKAFDLQKQNKLSFDQNLVKEDSFEKDDYKEFEYFEKLIDEI